MSVTVESESFVVDTNTGTAEQVMADLQTGDATLQKDRDSATAAATSAAADEGSSLMRCASIRVANAQNGSSGWA